MKKLVSSLIVLSASAGCAVAAESAVVFADAGLSTGDVAAQGPIPVGEDIVLTFDKGSAMSAPSISSAGRITITMGSSLTVSGLTPDVSITRIDLISNKASQTFSAGAASCVPEGTFTIDKTSFTSSWEMAEGANSVTITNTIGAPQVKEIRVTYTGGKGGGPSGDDKPDQPEDPDPVIPGDNVFSISFRTAEEFALLGVVNVESGSNTWRYDRNKESAYIMNDMGNTVGKDDYLVSPALELYAGHRYRVSFTASCENPAYPERISAFVGTAPTAEALSTEVVPPVVIDTRTPTEYHGIFIPETDGTYYAALHASSDPGMFYLYVSDFTVSRAVAPSSPAEVADLAVVPAPDGALTAAISLTAPSVSVDGSPLAELTSVTIMRGGTELVTIPAAPGDEISYMDAVEEAGTYTYTATAFGPTGKSYDSRATVYIGLAAPADPGSLTAEETDPGVVRFTWEPVSRNVYGEVLDPSVVTYRITANGSSRLVAEGLSGSSATLRVVEADDPQEISYFEIKAVTAAGASANCARSATVACGTPYQLPWAECFPGALHTAGNAHEVVADAEHASTFWSCFEAMVNDDIIPVAPDGGMLGLFSQYAGDTSVWRTAKINIPSECANPCLTFYYYAWPSADDILEVYADDIRIYFSTLDAESRGWKRAAVSLAEYRGRDIRLSFKGICADPAVRIAIDDIRVADEPAIDLALTRARIPCEMRRGSIHKCNVRVRNLGINHVDVYNVRVYAGDDELFSADGSLAPDATVSHDFELACPGGATSYTVVVTAPGDEVAENNSATVESVVADHYLAAPANLRAADGLLAWDAPVNAPRAITEGFEAYDEFVADCAGEWWFIDGDASPVLGIRDGYHGYPNMFSPMAFMVFNNHDGFFPRIGTSSFDPYEGGQCMMSASVDVINSSDRANDDWLVSPLLSGDAQRVSFYARSSGMVFPEAFKVMASSTDRLPSSFTEVLDVERAPSEWTRYEADLPEGTRYFAIRNVSHDQYMFFVDNVSFTAAPSAEAPSGYDLYLSDTSEGPWERLNDEPIEGTEFRGADVASGAWVKVCANYANGISLDSEPIEVALSGVMSPADDLAAEAVYFDTRGVRLAGKPAVPGVYVELRGGSARRIVVR